MQTKRGSLFEVICNVTSGVLSAFLAWQYIVVPWGHILKWDFNNMLIPQIICVNLVFTFISVIRGYGWRRLFNFLECKQIVK